MSNRTSNRISIEERIRSLENRLRMMQKLPPMEQGKTHLPGVVLNRNSEADSKGNMSGNQEPSQQQQQQQQQDKAAAAAANPNGTSANKYEGTNPSAATAAESQAGGAPPAGSEHGKEEQELEAYLHRVMTGCVSSKDPEKLAAEAEDKPSLPPDTQGLRYASVLLADAKKKNNNMMPTSRAAPSSAPAGSGGMDSPNRKKKTRYMLKAKKPRQVEEMDREDEEREEMSLIPKRKFRVVYRPKGKKGATEEEQEQASQKTFFSRTFTISGSDLNPVDLPMESMYFAKKKCETKTVRRPKPAPAKKPEKPVYRGCLNPSYSQTMPVPKHHEWCSPTLSGGQAGRRVSQPCEHTPSRSTLLAATLPTPAATVVDPLNNSEKRLGTPSMGSTSSSRRGQARSSSGVRLEPISPAEPNFALTPTNPADSDKPLGEQPQRLIAVSTTPDSTAPPQETTQTRSGSPSSHAREQDTTTITERAESRGSPSAGRRRASSPPASSPLQPSAPAGTSSSPSASQGFRRQMHPPSTAAASDHSGRHQGRGALGEMPGNRRGESLNHLAQKILLDLDKAGTAEENARSARLGLKKTYEENPRFASTIHPTGGDGGLSKSSLADLIAKRQGKTKEISSARFASTMPLPHDKREPRVPSPVLSVTVETTSPSGVDLRETERKHEEESQGSKPTAASRTTLIPNDTSCAEERRRRQVGEELRIARENAQFVQQVAPTPPPPTTEAGARWHAQRAVEEKARLAALIRDEAPVATNKEGPPAPVPEPVNPPEPEPERPAWLDDKLRESDRILLDYESAESKKEYRQLYLDYGHHLDGTEDGLLELWSALGGTVGWERALRPAQLSLLLSQEVTMKVRFRVGDDWLAYLGGTSIPKGEVTGFFSALLSRLPRLEFIELFDCPERPFSWSTVLQAHRAFQALKGAYFLYTLWTSTDVLQLVKLCPRIEKGKIRTDTHMQCILGLSAEQLMDECEGKVLVRSY